ncbi:MAG: RsmD family RNA methyltransferase [Treponema sp.]|nr:RsmD family RNA methyltransferase [Treponema sp.]
MAARGAALRITGGMLCGRRIQVPPGDIRPSMDQMRESVFACLGDLSGRSFLDIFSGSGIIALEAASRGAVYIEAVEKDPVKRKTILENVSISPVRIQCRFISAELYVQRAKTPFDCIFLDPPFMYRHKWELMSAIASSALVSDASIIMLHRPQQDFQKVPIAGLEMFDSRKYGRSRTDFFKAVKLIRE